MNRADQMALAAWLNQEATDLRRDAEVTTRRVGKRETLVAAATIQNLVNKVLSPEFPLAEATGRRKGPRS